VFTPLHLDSNLTTLQNWIPVEFPVKVENVRGREKEFTLDSAGFEFHKVPTREKNFESDESIRAVYYEDCIETIKNLTGASRVAIFDHSECSGSIRGECCL
jgi:hypothetical protein